MAGSTFEPDNIPSMGTDFVRPLTLTDSLLEEALREAGQHLSDGDYLGAAELYQKVTDACINLIPVVPAQPDAETESRIQDAIQAVSAAVAEGQCVLFLGAGVHYPPPPGSAYTYPPEHRPPLGAALSKDLAEQCGFRQTFPAESPRNLQRVSLYFEQKKNRRELVEHIRREVDGNGRRQPSAILEALASLPFPIVITTNYDRLFEQALRRHGKDPQVIVYDPSVTASRTDADQYSANRPILFKIHGDVDKPESIVVSDEDYIQFLLRMTAEDRFHPVPETIMYMMKKWPTLFLGYSLIDYNLRLLLKTLWWRLDSARRRGNYSVDKYPDLLIRSVWADQAKLVQFIPLDVWKFVPDLYQRVLGTEMPA